jgi:sulfide:quinone oxidoreductase
MNARVEGNRPRVLIAGGGVAGLEAALALRELAGERLAIELCSPRTDFVYRPFAVGEPYGAASILRYDLDALAERIGVSFRLGSIFSVDPAARTATVRDGEEIAYDHLLVASGVLRDVVFTMPGGNSWALPLYELALLGSSVLVKSGIENARLRIVTPEDAPLELFGRAVGVEMGALLRERGIEAICGVHPVAYEGGRLSVAPGEPIETDAVVSLPRLEGRRIDGLPADPEGFLTVDEHCRAIGAPDVYAAGDVTSFPVKQGGIATQEADVAAEAIAAAAGAEVEPAPFDPVLRAVLWTGAEPRYLYGRPAGGHGEVSTLTGSPPWHERDGKIIGRRLTPFLDGLPDVRNRALKVVQAGEE